MKTIALCCLYLVLATPVYAEWAADLALVSNYQVKGFSLNPGPALQPSLQWQAAETGPWTGVAAGIWLSNTHFQPDTTLPTIDSEIDWRVGKRWTFTPSKYCELNFLRYQFSGAQKASLNNYSEWQFGCGNSQEFLQLAYSAHYAFTRDRHLIISYTKQLFTKGSWLFDAEFNHLQNLDTGDFYQKRTASGYQDIQLSASFIPTAESWSVKALLGTANESSPLAHAWYSNVQLSWHF